jgi:hypothetical protein
VDHYPLRGTAEVNESASPVFTYRQKTVALLKEVSITIIPVALKMCGNIEAVKGGQYRACPGTKIPEQNANIPQHSVVAMNNIV